MGKLSIYLPPFAGDYSGVCSALYDFNCLIVLCDASCCRSLIENRRRIKNPAGALPLMPAPAAASAAPPPSADLDSEFYRRFLEILQAEMDRLESIVDALRSLIHLTAGNARRKTAAAPQKSNPSPPPSS